MFYYHLVVIYIYLYLALSQNPGTLSTSLPVCRANIINIPLKKEERELRTNKHKTCLEEQKINLSKA
jgi:hypothetical protein